MSSTRASSPILRSSSPCSTSQSYGKAGCEAKGMRPCPIRKSRMPRSAFHRRMVSSPEMFSRTIPRSFSTSFKLTSLRVRLVVAGIVRFCAGYPKRIMAQIYNNGPALAVSAFSSRPRYPSAGSYPFQRDSSASDQGRDQQGDDEDGGAQAEQVYKGHLY